MRRAGPAPDGGTAGSVEILIRIVEDTTPRGGGLDSDVWETEDHAYWQRVRLLDQVGPSRYEIEYICDDENEDDDSGGDDDDHDSIDDSGVGGSDRHTGADDNESEDAAACDHEPPSIQFETDGTPGKLRLFEPPNTAGQLLDWTGTLPSGMIEVHATPAAAGETARRKQRTAASTTSECSSKADGEFEDVIDVERRAFERGKVEGARDMHSQKFKEGFEFGEERGFADGFEIGSVHGFTQAVQDVFELLPATVVRKKVQQTSTKLFSKLSKFPVHDAQAPDRQAVRQSIQVQASLLEKRVGFGATATQPWEQWDAEVEPDLSF